MTYDNLKNKSKSQLIDIILSENMEKTDCTSDAINSIWSLGINENQENFILLCLDSCNQVLKKKVLFKGGISQCSVDIKLIFNEVLKTNRCIKFIVAHNHPTGDLEPSKPDLVLTERIKEGAELLSLSFLDHIIFSKLKYLSFQEKNLF